MSADPLIGTRLGDYVIEAQVGVGGMGIVYRARHPILKLAVAVKVMRNGAGSDEERARFEREALVMTSLKHPGILDIINFGALPDRRLYMVTEYLEGESLDVLLAREWKLPLRRALAIADELLDALAAAHAVGVVHRDLKPSNVFVVKHKTGAAYVKLLDFGLAKAGPLERGPGESKAKASIIAGTPHYISPEQARGLVATPRSDLYCLGHMLFQLVTGQLPFKGGSWAELVAAQLTRPAPRLRTLAPEVPEALDDLVAQLLEKDPKDRPGSAELVRLKLRALLRSLDDEGATRPAGLPAVRSTQEPPRWLLAGFVGLVALGAAGAAVGYTLLEPAEPAAPSLAAASAPRANAPAPVPPPPPAAAPQAVDPDFDARMKAALDKEREASRAYGERDFLGRVHQLGTRGTGPGPTGEDDTKTSLNSALAAQMVHHKEIARTKDAALTGEQRMREEVRQARRLEELENRCADGWKKKAVARLKTAKQEQLKRLDPDDQNRPARVQSIEDDARDLRTLVESARTLEDCGRAMDTLERWSAGR